MVPSIQANAEIKSRGLLDWIVFIHSFLAVLLSFFLIIWSIDRFFYIRSIFLMILLWAIFSFILYFILKLPRNLLLKKLHYFEAQPELSKIQKSRVEIINILIGLIIVCLTIYAIYDSSESNKQIIQAINLQGEEGPYLIPEANCRMVTGAEIKEWDLNKEEIQLKDDLIKDSETYEIYEIILKNKGVDQAFDIEGYFTFEEKKKFVYLPKNWLEKEDTLDQSKAGITLQIGKIEKIIPYDEKRFWVITTFEKGDISPLEWIQYNFYSTKNHFGGFDCKLKRGF